MTWLRLDDCFPEHPKVIGLSDRSFRLHVTALCYCARHLTDGQIPSSVVDAWRSPAAVSELVSAKLWRKNRRGYTIKDYLEYNPSKAEVEQTRMKWRERAAAGGRAKAAKRLLEAERKQVESSAPIPIPIPSPIPGHTPSPDLPAARMTIEIKANDIDPGTRHEIERLASLLPDPKMSAGRMVKQARNGATSFMFADARQALQTVAERPVNPGAWVCDIVDKHIRGMG